MSTLKVNIKVKQIGDLKSSQDVILSLKNTIANKKDIIDSLEAKIIGFNRVIANLSTSNFTMLSSKITEMEGRVKHYEDLYKQEILNREKVEEAFKILEIKKLRVEKDHKESLDSYTKIFAEIKKLKTENQKLAQNKVDSQVVTEQEKHIKKLKKQIEDLDNSLKEIISQNSGLRSSIDSLKIEKERLIKEKEETLKTYIELVDQTFEWNNEKENDKIDTYKLENENLRKELAENHSTITDLQLELSEFKKKNNSLQRMVSESWSTKNDIPDDQISTLKSSSSISTGLLSIGQRRIFIKDPDSEYARYIPTIFDVDEDEINQDMSKTNR